MEAIYYALITVGIIIFIVTLILSYRSGHRSGYYKGFEDGYTNSPHYTEEQIIEMLAKTNKRRSNR